MVGQVIPALHLADVLCRNFIQEVRLRGNGQYGQVRPKEALGYDITKIKVPMKAFYGGRDQLCSLEIIYFRESAGREDFLLGQVTASISGRRT